MNKLKAFLAIDIAFIIVLGSIIFNLNYYDEQGSISDPIVDPETTTQEPDLLNPRANGWLYIILHVPKEVEQVNYQQKVLEAYITNCSIEPSGTYDLCMMPRRLVSAYNYSTMGAPPLVLDPTGKIGDTVRRSMFAS